MSKQHTARMRITFGRNVTVEADSEEEARQKLITGGAAMVERLRQEWGNETTGETWELFLERELAYLLPRMERAKELLGLCRMRGDLPKDLYDSIDDVLDREYRE